MLGVDCGHNLQNERVIEFLLLSSVIFFMPGSLAECLISVLQHGPLISKADSDIQQGIQRITKYFYLH